jgi:uncharacterized protein YbaP (TraB family)
MDRLFRLLPGAPRFFCAALALSAFGGVCGLATGAAAQAGTAIPIEAVALAAPAPPAPTVSAHPALWRVRRGETTVYLFGTVHALPSGVHWFAGPVASAFEGSGELVTEIIEKSPEEMRQIVTAKALLPDGQSLRQQLPLGDRRAFERAMAGNGLSVAAFDRFRPWYAAVALSALPLIQSGYDASHGADAELAERAGKLGRAHVALETPEFQLGLFAAMPQATQLRYLHEVVHTMPTIQRELSDMVRAWESGNAPRLAQLMNSDSDDPSLRDALLVRRNKAWARWIKTRLARPGTVFIAVGAGHLAGPDSLQAQLKALGIRSSRVQ